MRLERGKWARRLQSNYHVSLTELDWQEGNKKREDCKFVFIQAETFGLFPSLFCWPNGCKFFNKALSHYLADPRNEQGSQINS